MAEEKQSAKRSLRDEKRTVERNQLVFYLRVFDKDSRQILGHLTEISSSGLMLVSRQQIREGQHYNARLILPKEVSGRTEMGLKISCAWCRPDSIEQFHVVGFQFVEIDLEQKKLIDALIGEFGKANTLIDDHPERPACNLDHIAGR